MAACHSCIGICFRFWFQITEDESKGTSMTQSSTLAKVVVSRKKTTGKEKQKVRKEKRKGKCYMHVHNSCSWLKPDWVMRSTGSEHSGKRSSHTQGLPHVSRDIRLFSVTLIKFCAWCLHKNKTRCLRSDSTLYSLTSIPALPHHFQEIGFLPKRQGREGEKEKNSSGVMALLFCWWAVDDVWWIYLAFMTSLRES